MKELKCKDLGEECEAIIRAESIEEVKELALKHLQQAHSGKLNAMPKTELARFKESLDQWISDV